MYYVMMRINKDETYEYGRYETKEQAEAAMDYVQKERKIYTYIEEEYVKAEDIERILEKG